MLGLINQNHSEAVVSEIHSSTMSIDAGQGVIHSWTATGDETVNFLNGQAGMRLRLIITCDALAHTITLGTGAAGAISSYLLTSLKKSILVLEHDGITFNLLTTVTNL
jgi:hypothetical protein